MQRTASDNSEKSNGDHRDLVDANPIPAGLQQASKDEELELLNNTLTESYYSLAGGQEEFKKISSWMLANPNVEEVQAHAKPIPGGFSFLIQETRFARVIRRYEAENSLPKR